jgi:catechol 2,3-dioxygenase-like lactoylglutathione lyase family enzyme
MLKDIKSHTTLPAADIDRAKAFYREKLGLEPSGEAPGGVFFETAGGTRFALYPTPNTNRGGHTQMGFTVNDVEAEVANLKERGVVFEEYDLPGLKTENGVAATGGGRAAWFKDSEGNTIGLIELEDASLR